VVKTGGGWSKQAVDGPKQVVGGQNRWLVVKTGGRWFKTGGRWSKTDGRWSKTGGRWSNRVVGYPPREEGRGDGIIIVVGWRGDGIVVIVVVVVAMWRRHHLGGGDVAVILVVVVMEGVMVVMWRLCGGGGGDRRWWQWWCGRRCHHRRCAGGSLVSKSRIKWKKKPPSVGGYRYCHRHASSSALTFLRPHLAHRHSPLLIFVVVVIRTDEWWGER